jgi:TonB family protein
MNRLLRVSLLLVVLFQLIPSQWADDARGYSYHVRVIRVRGAADVPGAALGSGKDNGQPLLPDAEHWGNPDQVLQIADLLGRGIAEPVTGLLISPDNLGDVRADRIIYAGAQALHVNFHAVAPTGDREQHDLTLRIFRKGTSEPLIDAHLIASTSRTTAIAAPLEESTEWLVVGITPIPVGLSYFQDKDKALLLDSPMTPPELLTRSDPFFPPAARARSPLDGKVILQVIVDRDGSVQSPVVLRVPENGEDLVISALEAVSRWRYKPALKDGVPVPVYISLVIRFQIGSGSTTNSTEDPH